ncbi:unnamed protein product [Somion occarium]|uniref:1-alkyl-2-acetylglycerophosphocholine esterase n=1 Tax=Somion occarium TaxID=3059160 RepID=A0ABP1CZM1_9APHY
MFTLPDIPGRYNVGCTMFAARLPSEVTIPSSKFRPENNLRRPPYTPPLVLKEIAFTAYYPADVSSLGTRKCWQGHHRYLPWLPRPIKEVLRGYAHFGNVSFWFVYILCRAFVSHIKFPAHLNAPLLSPLERKDDRGRPWPLVIFSHGLGGTRTSYSHFCSRLAAQGRVVLAIEHQDGTAPIVTPLSPVPGLEKEFQPEYRLYTKLEDVYWDNDTGDKYAFKAEQLLYRRLEVYLMHKFFKHLIESDETTLPIIPSCNEVHTVDGPWNFNLNNRPDDLAFWKSWHMDSQNPDRKVECNRDISLTGHSFGGATVLSILSEPPPTLYAAQFDPIPFNHALALDPWVDPLPSPGPSPWQVEESLRHSPTPPELLVINSEDFTFWDEHFDRLKQIVETWNQSDNVAKATLLTILRCKHISFSDVELLLPFGRRKRAARKLIDIIFDLSDAFLDNRLEDALRYHQLRDDKTEWVRKPKKEKEGKRRLVGELGDIVRHV